MTETKTRTCQCLVHWETGRGDFNRRELHETWCDRPATATIPAERSLDHESVDVCESHDGENNFSIADAPDGWKFCRLCHSWDETTDGHGLGECIIEYEPEHPDV